MQQFRTDSLFPQGQKFHDMIAKGNSASFEQAVQELLQSKKRPAKQKPENPCGFKHVPQTRFQTLLGGRFDGWRRQQGGVF